MWGCLLETWLMWPWWVMIPKEDLTDVTLVSGDTFLRLDWCDSGEWGYLLETWLVWLWCVIIPYLLSYHIFCHTFWRFDSLIPKEDLADVTLVSEDTFYWWKLCIDESCLLMKVVYWWKLSTDERCLFLKVVYWWMLSIDESCLLLKFVHWRKLK